MVKRKIKSKKVVRVNKKAGKHSRGPSGKSKVSKIKKMLRAISKKKFRKTKRR